MKFRSTLPQAQSPLNITHETRILALGSCFADRIGNRLLRNRFEVKTNPLGIAYNPISLVRQLNWIMGKEELDEVRYQDSHARWHSFDLHSHWSHPEQQELITRLATAREELKEYLAGTELLMLTFGTARVYRFKDTQRIVANNYAYPANNFSRDLLEPAYMLESLSLCIDYLEKLCPRLHILISLSPIRHIRDGLEENSVSKANLRILCQKLVEQYDQVHYFPAYEIMMDDLRDYRFYEADLIHPNEQAETYIWEYFTQRHMRQEELDQLKLINSILKDLNHKPFNTTSPAYKKFLKATLQKIETLAPEISFAQEAATLQKLLAEIT